MSNILSFLPPARETRDRAISPMRPLEQLDDGALVQAVVEGTPRAAAVFFDRFSANVERQLRRLLGPDADVAVAVNEVFLRALDRLGDVSASAGLRTWLHAIAVYVAKEQRRARKRWGFLEFRPWELLAETAGSVEAAPLEAREALRRVYGVLDRLSEDDRALFVLRFIEELELTEVAELHGVSLASVKRHLARAQKRFFAAARGDAVLLEWLGRGSSLGEASS